MGTVSQACLNMKAFVIVALVAAVAGEADPYTIGQVLAGQTNGGVLTSTTYHGGVKVAGFPYTAVAAPVVSHTYGYPYAYYGKREAEAEPEPQRCHRSHCCPPRRGRILCLPLCLLWLPLRLLRQEGGRAQGRPRPGVLHWSCWLPLRCRSPCRHLRWSSPRRCLHSLWCHPLFQRWHLHQR